MPQYRLQRISPKSWCSHYLASQCAWYSWDQKPGRSFSKYDKLNYYQRILSYQTILFQNECWYGFQMFISVLCFQQRSLAWGIRMDDCGADHFIVFCVSLNPGAFILFGMYVERSVQWTFHIIESVVLTGMFRVFAGSVTFCVWVPENFTSPSSSPSPCILIKWNLPSQTFMMTPDAILRHLYLGLYFIGNVYTYHFNIVSKH